MNRRGRGGGGPWAPKSAWECKTKKPKSHTRPPNLRGREIGMYYKKLSQERREAGIEVPKTPKPFMLGFGIPPGVESRVRVNLETISKLATDLNISINPTENIFPIKKEVIDQADQSEPSTSTEGNNCHPKVGTDKFNINWEPNVVSAEASAVMFTEDINNDEFHVFKKPNIPSTSSAPDFIPVSNENPNHYGSGKKLLSLRGGGDYKYGYEDIITGSFDEKLDECIKKGVGINVKTQDILDISASLYEEYKVMECKPKYKKMMEFRKKLPTYKKAPELLNVIEENQVIVISGETGCGKSTQVPQLILDNALRKCLGANTHILCTQPRRIAASSLAMRVAEERAEQLGNSVGYAVRLEKVESRPRGSIMYVTTGILLADLETDQGLTSYSHVILDEVHERDCHIDLSMCMLKKVLKKRKEMKLILMSATIDAEKLSQYFDDCPMIHIEGLAYPVEDVYLEDILLMTNYKLPPETSQPFRGHRHRRRERRDANMEPAIKYRAEIDGWLSQQCRNRPEIHRIRDTLADHRIEDINIELIVNLLICLSKEPPGAILVFVPGIGDITKMIKVMESTGAFPRYYFDIYPLHSKLATLDQHRIFERPREGVRKIIIATNIAETSITIDDIVYVVDCAKLKISGLNVQDNVSTLKVEWVSQANLRQRRGRAGRCQPGICYHLVTSYRAGKLAERLLPELQRSDLLEPVLSIKRLRLGMAADAMSILPAPPAQSTVDWAVKHLQQCGALNSKETLTPLGWHLARLPVHPSAGKLLLLGALFGCLDRAASVAAVWGFKDPFQLVIGKEREVDEAKRRFSLGEPSDHLAISEAIIQWEKCSPHSRFNFAYRNFLSNNTLELLSDMKNQLGDSLKQMGFLPTGNVKAPWENRNADNLSLFKAIVAASLYPKIAMVRWMGLRKNRPRVKVILPEFGETGRRQKVTVHPSSIMATGYKTNCVQICRNPGANWCVYWILQRSSDLFLIDVTLVYTLPLLFFGELVVKVFEETEEDGEMCLMSISSVNVRCKKTTAITLIELRALLDQVLASRVTVAGRDTVHCDFQECVLNAVIELITAEDERAEYVGDDDSSETSEVE